MNTADKLSQHGKQIGIALDKLLQELAGEKVGFGLVLHCKDRSGTFVSNIPVEDVQHVMRVIIQKLRDHNG